MLSIIGGFRERSAMTLGEEIVFKGLSHVGGCVAKFLCNCLALTQQLDYVYSEKESLK